MIIEKRLWQEALKYKKELAAAVFFSLLGGILILGQAGFLAQIINKVFLEGADLPQVFNWLAGLAVIIILKTSNTWLSETAAQSLAAKVKAGFYEILNKKIFALGPIYMAGKETGDLVNLLTEGVENLETYFSRFVPQLFNTLIIPLLTLAVVFKLDPTIALIMLTTIPLIPIFMILIGKKADKKNKEQFEELSRMSAHFLDVLEGLPTLKLFGKSKEQVNVVARMAGGFRDTALSVLRIAFLSSLSLELIATIGTALVAVTVGLKVLYGQSAFRESFFILLLIPEFYMPFRQFGTHYHSAMGAAASADKIYSVLAEKEAEPEKGDLVFLKQENISIAFENISFSYENSLCPALDRVSFTAGAGKKIALVGPSGAGKSTIAALLLKLIAIQEGNILINSMPLDDIKKADWLTNVAYVPQQPHLFYGSILENIRFGTDAPLSLVMEAAKEAQIHDFISLLPKGYDTIVGEGGRSLSGGERQRLAIARAFLRRAGLVIFDEATTGLDVKTQAAVTEAAWRLFQGRTAIIIAHRLTTIHACDMIIVLEEGRIAECGNHSRLLDNNGLYREMISASLKRGS